MMYKGQIVLKFGDFTFISIFTIRQDNFLKKACHLLVKVHKENSRL